MTLPTGTISLSDANVELGRSSSAMISLGETAVRGLAGKPSGAVSMNDLRGKSARTVSITLINNQTIYSGPNQYSRLTFMASASDGAPISSIVWHGVTTTSGNNGIVDTPPYDPNGFTRQEYAEVSCTVVFAGTTYTPSLSYQYTAGDLALEL